MGERIQFIEDKGNASSVACGSTINFGSSDVVLEEGRINLQMEHERGASIDNTMVSILAIAGFILAVLSIIISFNKVSGMELSRTFLIVNGLASFFLFGIVVCSIIVLCPQMVHFTADGTDIGRFRTMNERVVKTILILRYENSLNKDINKNNGRVKYVQCSVILLLLSLLAIVFDIVYFARILI